MKKLTLGLLALSLPTCLAPAQDHILKAHVMKWAAAQPLPVTLDVILLGDTITPPPKCEGCDAAAPEIKNQEGGWDDMDTPANSSEPYEFPVSLPADPVAAWDVSDGNGGGFGLVLEELQFYDVDGDCQYDTDISKCKNGDSCQFNVYMKFYMSSTDSTPGNLTINIPGMGAASLSPGNPTGPNAQGFYEWTWWEWNMHQIVPGCARSMEWKLDPDVMAPETGQYDIQGTNTPATPIEFKFSCEVCPEDPVT